MIIRKEERTKRSKENLLDGPGTVYFEDIADNSEMYDKTNMYSVITLKKDCGIGYHCHIDEEEVMLIIEGKAAYNDDGKECEVSEGDVCICKDGHYHSITNVSQKEVKVVAIKLKK